jgi:hypothetical protein
MTDTLDDQLTTAANKLANLSDIVVVCLHVLSWLLQNKHVSDTVFLFFDP